MKEAVLQTDSNSIVTVLGAGYVGLTTAALLANSGHKTYLVEPDKERLETIKSGKSFFYEEGLDALVSKAVESKSLIATDSYKESVPDSQFVFSCVGTPDNQDGSSNLSYVFAAAKEAGKYLKPGEIYIQKSTVPVGSGEKVIKLLPKHAKYVSNPEFLKEGTAIIDSLFFDRVVVGGDSTATDKVIRLYKSIEKNKENIVKLAGLKDNGGKGEYIKTNLNSAELIKVSANAFLALKISFANSIAKLADQTGADIKEVMEAVGSDRRIGKAFFNAGRGYGGGCFPKDVSGLISSAEEHGVTMEIMSSAVKVNDTMADYIVDRVKQKLGGSLKGKKIAVLGLAFKAGTSDARRSPAVKIANLLAVDGAKVSAYDPKANNDAKSKLQKSIDLFDSEEEATKKASAVLVATDWPEFIKINKEKLKINMSGNLLVDCMNIFNLTDVQSAGFQYIGVGRNKNKNQ
jgi:UDPglucose 6-dehydrogenase